MRITKLGHACLRIEHDGVTLVLDPGVFTDPGAAQGADAVLVTHEHPDHYSPDQLRAVEAPIFTVDGVAAQLATDAPDVAERVTVVGPGVDFEAAGIAVTTVGEWHAVIHPEFPALHNSGYLLEVGDTTIYHPGDALALPEVPVDVLLVPVSAPWLKLSECVDFARAVGAPRNLAIHDRVYSELGLGVVDNALGHFLGAAGLDYARIPDGTDL